MVLYQISGCIFFPVVKDKIINLEIRQGVFEEKGWNNRGNLLCPICGNSTGVKEIKKAIKRR